MSQVITATFEDGVFKPDQPPDLPAQARVQLVVVPEGETPEETARQTARRETEWLWNDSKRPEAAARDAVWEEFERISDEFPIDSGGPIPTREELYDRHRY